MNAVGMRIGKLFLYYGCLVNHRPVSPRLVSLPSLFLSKVLLSTSVDRYCTLLEQILPRIKLERALDQVKSKVDSLCVQTALQKPSIGRDRALRFFIWAGQQSYYRHSAFMYACASECLRISTHPEALLDILETYRGENLRVSIKAFKVILNICKEVKLADYALKVLRKMKEFNCHPDTVSYNVVIQLFCDKNDIDVIEDLVREMALIGLFPDMITYITAIKGLCNTGRLDDARKLFDQMCRSGCSPNKIVYSALVHGACLVGRLDIALEILGDMEKESFSCGLNAVAYTSLVQSLCERRLATEAVKVLERMSLHECAPNWVTARTLINGLIVEGHIYDAYKVVNKMISECKSLSADKCYSGLLVSLIEIKNVDEAEKVVMRMLAEGIKPTGFATNVLMSELSTSEWSVDGFRQCCKLVKCSLYTIDLYLFSLLLVNLCQGSQFDKAGALIDEMTTARIPIRHPQSAMVVELLKKAGEENLAKLLMTGENN